LLRKYLKKFEVPQILIFNKEDLINSEEKLYSYQSLGSQYSSVISALKERGFDELINQIISLVPSSSKSDFSKDEVNELKLVIFGPPNSGKSTLMNYLLKANRSLATPIAGTTQEPVISN
jgi:GTP-binding protein